MERESEVLMHLLRLTESGDFVNMKSPDGFAFVQSHLFVVVYDCELHQCPRCLTLNKVRSIETSDEERRKQIVSQLRRDKKHEERIVRSKSSLLVVWNCQLVDNPLRVVNNIRAAQGLPMIAGETVSRIVQIVRRNA